MLNRFLKSIIFLFFTSTLCFALEVEENHAQSLQYAKIFYEKNTHIYDYITFLAIENGFSPLSYKTPQSVAELYKTFSQINLNKLSNLSVDVFEDVKLLFKPVNYLLSHENFKFNINGNAALQGKLFYRGENAPRIDKFLNYNTMPAPLAIPFEFLITNYFYTYCCLTLQKNFAANELSYPYTNLPFMPFDKNTDFHIPTQAGISIGSSFFNINIGRGALNIGRTLSGSLLLADTVDRLDYFQASVFAKNVKLELNIVQNNATRFLFTHSIIFRPIKQISITLHEGVLVNSFFDPRYLNPAMIFHSHAPWKENYLPGTTPPSENGAVGCQFGFAIDAVPVKGLRVYGQFAMNQFQTPSELKGLDGKNYTPNSLACLLGSEYVHPTNVGYIVLALEFLYANPWFNILSNKGISFIHERKEMASSTKKYDDSTIRTWLSNPYGPDSIASIAQISLIKPKDYKASLTYRLLCKGENESRFFENPKSKIYYPDAKNSGLVNLKTPSGLPTYYNTIKILGSYNILNNLLIQTSFAWTHALGKIHGNSIDFSVSLEYTVR